MPLNEIAIDLNDAEGVQLVLDLPVGNLATASTWHLKEIRRTAISSRAHDFFQVLRRRATELGITLGTAHGRFLSNELSWTFVDMGTQAATPELRKIMAEITAPLLNHTYIDFSDGIDDIRSGTTVQLFLRNTHSEPADTWVWSDYVERVVK